MVVTDKDFEKEVLGSDRPVLVDFWSSWCPPCKMMEPVVEGLSQELYGKALVAKINVDQNPKIAARYAISGVPTFILFKEGKEVQRCTGARSKKQMIEMLGKCEKILEDGF